MVFRTADLLEYRDIRYRTAQIGVTDYLTRGNRETLVVSIVSAVVLPKFGRIIVPIVRKHVQQIDMEQYGKDVGRGLRLNPHLFVDIATFVTLCSHPIYRSIERGM